MLFEVCFLVFVEAFEGCFEMLISVLVIGAGGFLLARVDVSFLVILEDLAQGFVFFGVSALQVGVCQLCVIKEVVVVHFLCVCLWHVMTQPVHLIFY